MYFFGYTKELFCLNLKNSLKIPSQLSQNLDLLTQMFEKIT